MDDFFRSVIGEDVGGGEERHTNSLLVEAYAGGSGRL